MCGEVVRYVQTCRLYRYPQWLLKGGSGFGNIIGGDDAVKRAGESEGKIVYDGGGDGGTGVERVLCRCSLCVTASTH